MTKTQANLNEIKATSRNSISSQGSNEEIQKLTKSVTSHKKLSPTQALELKAKKERQEEMSIINSVISKYTEKPKKVVTESKSDKKEFLTSGKLVSKTSSTSILQRIPEK